MTIRFVINFRGWSDRRGACSILYSATREMRNQKNKFRKMEYKHGRTIGEYYILIEFDIDRSI